MTAQLRKKETMQECTTHPDFLFRWLNGDLTEAELASLRNRKEYEEMVASCNAGITLASDQDVDTTTPIVPINENLEVAKTANTNAFVIFVAITIVAFMAGLYIVKFSGWF